MMKAHNMLFSVLLCVFLMGPICMFAAEKLHVDLPTWLTAEDAKWLEASTNTYDIRANLSLKGFASKSLQDAIEFTIADCIPAKASIMIANATAERWAIQLSNRLFSWRCYPTFFGSDMVGDQMSLTIYGSALPIPAEETESKLDAWINAINATARQYPNMQIIVNLLFEPDRSEVNPTYTLKGGDGLVDKQWVQNTILPKFDKSIEAFCDPISSEDSLFADWMPTDSHWGIKRALQTYNRLADYLNLLHAKYDDSRTIRITDTWYGEYARFGLDLDYQGYLIDQPDDFSNLVFYRLEEFDNGPIELGLRERILNGEASSADMSPFNCYSQYYGAGSVEVFNLGPNNGKTCIVIADCYSHCLKRYIANNYLHTVFLLPANDSLQRSLKNYVEAYEPDDMIVMVQCLSYLKVSDLSPEFLNPS